MDKIIFDELVLTTNKQVAEVLKKKFFVEAWHIPNGQVAEEVIKRLHPAHPENIYLVRNKIFIDCPEWLKINQLFPDYHFPLCLISNFERLHYLCHYIARFNTYLPYTKRKELKNFLLFGIRTGDYRHIFNIFGNTRGNEKNFTTRHFKAKDRQKLRGHNKHQEKR